MPTARPYFAALHQALESQYQPCDCPACRAMPTAHLSFGNEKENLLKTAEKAFKFLHKKGTYKPEDLAQYKTYKDLISETASVFTSAIPHEVPQEMKAYLEKDAFIFSGLKIHAQLTEARSFLKDENGNITPYEKFEQKILKLNEQYNRNYLEAEYEFAVHSAQSAANWANLQNDTERYWLEYRTAGDERVRVEHQALNGICLPKDDAFWTEYYPPNGWRCRCIAVEVLAREKTLSDSEKARELGEKATTQLAPSPSERGGVRNKLAMFRFNPGMEQKIFPPKNAYAKVVGAEQVKKVLKNNDNKKIKDTKYTPKEIHQYEKELGIKINRSIFEHLTKETPLLFQNPIGVKGSGAYYSPYHNAVKIPIDNRRRNSKWYAEAVVYHEFGHAADYHINLRNAPEITQLMNKYTKILNFREIDQRALKFQNFAIKRGHRDMLEKVGAVRDTLMSLNTNYGFGHTKAYYKKAGNRQAEFIAHAFENTYAGNEVFKKLMPELYEEMQQLIKNAKPK